MLKYLEQLYDYKGAIFAFIVMYIIVENTTKKDILVRLTVLAFTTSEATYFTQWLFGWGDQFLVLSQAIGVFSIWVFIGLSKCVLLKTCRQSIIDSVEEIVKVTKWGKK